MERRTILIGPDGGPRLEALAAGEGPRLALLLHGFPDDPRSMVPLMEGLAARGYLAVAPYLRGYGPSAPPPDGDYSLARLGADALGAIEALGSSRALLVGHDWGAAAAYAAAALAPERIERLVALSVPPPRVFLHNLVRSPSQLRRSAYMGLFQLRGVAERALAARDFWLIERLWRRWSPGWSPPPGRLAEVKETFRTPGTAAHALAYYRALAPSWRASWRRSWRLARRPIRVPTRVLIGARDGCIAPGAFAGLGAALSGDWRLDVVPDAGHFLPLEAPERVLEAALEPS